jgi:hypothetical protein
MTHSLGHKASAEQFDPRELVEIAVGAKAHGQRLRPLGRCSPSECPQSVPGSLRMRVTRAYGGQ